MDDLAQEQLTRWCQRTLPDDTRAFERLVAEYKQRVFAVIVRTMGNRHDAEDVAQEVFLKVYRGIGTLKDGRTLTAWIYRVAVTTSLDALRRDGRLADAASRSQPDDDAAAFPDIPDVTISTPEEAVIQREARECIEAAIRELEPIARSALILRDVEDRPYQEIAETLGVGLSAVKMRIHRARLAFQQLLEQVCPGVWPSAGEPSSGSLVGGSVC